MITKVADNVIYLLTYLVTMPDGHVTMLSKANDKSQSLRTTVPAFFIQQAQLKEGDGLLWMFDKDEEQGIYLKVFPHHNGRRMKKRKKKDKSDGGGNSSGNKGGRGSESDDAN